MQQLLAYSWAAAWWSYRHLAVQPIVDRWVHRKDGRLVACNPLVASMLDQGLIELDCDEIHAINRALECYGERFVVGFDAGIRNSRDGAPPPRRLIERDGYLCGQFARERILAHNAEGKQPALI